MSDKAPKPIWPNVVKIEFTGAMPLEARARLDRSIPEHFSWVFHTWNEHADADDASLFRQYSMRDRSVLPNVEKAILANRRTDEQNLYYLQRLRSEMVWVRR